MQQYLPKLRTLNLIGIATATLGLVLFISNGEVKYYAQMLSGNVSSVKNKQAQVNTNNTCQLVTSKKTIQCGQKVSLGWRLPAGFKPYKFLDGTHVGTVRNNALRVMPPWTTSYTLVAIDADKTMISCQTLVKVKGKCKNYKAPGNYTALMFGN